MVLRILLSAFEISARAAAERDGNLNGNPCTDSGAGEISKHLPDTAPLVDGTCKIRSSISEDIAGV